MTAWVATSAWYKNSQPTRICIVPLLCPPRGGFTRAHHDGSVKNRPATGFLWDLGVLQDNEDRRGIASVRRLEKRGELAAIAS